MQGFVKWLKKFNNRVMTNATYNMQLSKTTEVLRVSKFRFGLLTFCHNMVYFK